MGTLMYIALASILVAVILFFIIRKKVSSENNFKSIQELEKESKAKPVNKQPAINRDKIFSIKIPQPKEENLKFHDLGIHSIELQNQLKKISDSATSDNPDSPRLILEALKANNPIICQYAAEASLTKRLVEAVPDLLKILQKTDQSFIEARKVAAKALGAIGEAQSINSLRKLYSTEEDHIVKVAIGDTLAKLLYTTK
jgi:HEAT repeat protein